jgi:anhydro-N-acetylmuramic acid kinase
MNAADAAVAPAVGMALPEIAALVEAIVEHIPQGGRVYYIGAGTSGRLGVLDASEWYPTFGTEHDQVKAVMAGGPEAVFRSIEGAEDSASRGAADLEEAGAQKGDVVIGITASGTTPYVRGALEWARGQHIFCAGIICHKTANFPADVIIEIPVGPEFVEGSSRLKAGTAAKLVLNLISTVSMIRLGRVQGGRMIEVRTLSDKLRRRAEDIVASEGGVSPEDAAGLLKRAGEEIKTAIVMARSGLSAEEARAELQKHEGRLKELPPEIGVHREAISLPALFSDYARLSIRRIIGLMSGTSADGVHAALVEVSGQGEMTAVRLLDFSHESYGDDLRRGIFRLFDADCPPSHLCEMNFAMGEVFASAALRLAAAHGGVETIHLIASHGQTVSHLPERRTPATPTGATLQIGEPAVIAERTGLTVAADFRVADVAAGGQGAPLSAFADYVLFRHPARGRAIQNLGGIGNVTFLPAGCRLEEVIAFDTGPGNMLIDAVTEVLTDGRLTFDENGEYAARGQTDSSLLAWLMKNEFISRTPPKTAGREEFGRAFAAAFLGKAKEKALSAEDTIATATAFTAESMADAYRRFLMPKGRVDEVILGGGGTYNQTLRQFIKECLPEVEVYAHEDFGIPGHAKEALSFAILGNQTMLGQPGAIPSVTGASRPMLLGKIIPGRRPLQVLS